MSTVMSRFYKGLKKIDYPDIALFIFLGVVSSGLVHSQNTDVALRRYLLSYLPAVFIYMISKNIPKNFYMPLARLMSLISVLISIFIIVEFFSGKNFIYEHIWNSPYFDRTFYRNRAFGVFSHPTITGNFLTLCLPFTWLYLHDTRNKADFMAGSMFFIFISIAIVATLSKMAIIVMLLIYLWYARQKNGHIDSLLLMSFFILAVILFLRSGVIINKFGPHFSVVAVTYRLKSLKVAISMLADHPFVGVGMGHFRLLYSNYSTVTIVGQVLKTPDNAYLAILAETGIIAFVAFSIFIFILIKRTLLALNNLNLGPKRLLLQVVLMSFVGAVLYNLSYDAFYWTVPMSIFWALAGIMANLSESGRLGSTKA